MTARLLLLLALLLPAAADAAGTISRAELKALRDSGAPVTLVDVRSSAEYAGGHIPGAINIPHDQVAGRAAELGQGQVVLYCRSGRRSALAAADLEARGRGNLWLLEGDMPGWQQAGEPVAPCPAC